jgi:Skp family chaperone for outer membrane proteins
MPADKHAQAKLSDLNDKLQNAKDAARSGDAGEREKADLKLLEQEVTAQKLKAKRPAPKEKKAESEVDAKLDKALKDSFPGSDPVSFVEAAPIKKQDRTLSTVPDEDEDTK